MTDIFSKKKRSEVMSKIRGKWTKQEVCLHNYLKARKIRHKMHPKMFGSPDIIFAEKRLVVFLDGCFWHKCPKDFIKPATRTEFWMKKINENVKRDKKINKELADKGWKVFRFWEHDTRKNPKKVASKIIRYLE